VLQSINVEKRQKEAYKMSQSYKIVGSVEDLRCSKKDFDALKKAWNDAMDGQDDDGFAVDSDGFDVDLLNVEGKFGNLYIYADEFGDEGAIPEKILKNIGGIIDKAGLPYLTFGYAIHNSRNLPGSAGGGEFRLYPDGKIKEPKISWE
jgi:hypothetical protein